MDRPPYYHLPTIPSPTWRQMAVQGCKRNRWPSMMNYEVSWCRPPSPHRDFVTTLRGIMARRGSGDLLVLLWIWKFIHQQRVVWKQGIPILLMMSTLPVKMEASIASQLNNRPRLCTSEAVNYRMDWEAPVLINHAIPSQTRTEEVQRMERGRADLEPPPARQDRPPATSAEQQPTHHPQSQRRQTDAQQLAMGFWGKAQVSNHNREFAN